MTAAHAQRMHSTCTAHAQHMHSTCKAHAGAGLVAACLTQTRTLTLITDYYHLAVGQRLDVRHRVDVVVVALDERLALTLRAHLCGRGPGFCRARVPEPRRLTVPGL